GVRPELAPGGDQPLLRPPALTDAEKSVTGPAPCSRIVLLTGPRPAAEDPDDRPRPRRRADLPLSRVHRRSGPPPGARPGCAWRGGGAAGWAGGGAPGGGAGVPTAGEPPRRSGRSGSTPVPGRRHRPAMTPRRRTSRSCPRRPNRGRWVGWTTTRSWRSSA